MNKEERKELLMIAKQSILNGIDFNVPKPETLIASYSEIRATFLTLKSNAMDLRGCIGSIIPHNSLGEDVWTNAQNAAFNDPRFPGLTIDEVNNDKNFTIEISVLTLPQEREFESADQLMNYLQDNKPGVIISKDGYKSTFLPDVWEQLPDVRSFLNQLVIKSGYDVRKFWTENPVNWKYELYDTERRQEKWINI